MEIKCKLIILFFIYGHPYGPTIGVTTDSTKIRQTLRPDLKVKKLAPDMELPGYILS